MKEEFPIGTWYLKIDDENRDIVNNWRINIIKYSERPCKYKYISENGIGDDIGPNDGFNTAEITTSQFKEYVLNIKEEPIPIINEDLTYLKDMLNKLNIK